MCQHLPDFYCDPAWTPCQRQTCRVPAMFDALTIQLRDSGYAFVRSEHATSLLSAFNDGNRAGLSDWTAFADSWNRLALDTYMADGGRYRRRRHAVFNILPGHAAERGQHQPHYQGLEYNRLNGGIERWFEPMEEAVASGPTMTCILAFCRTLFESLMPQTGWHVETHQFRIEATADGGKPTPEGLHRDGVDYVLVLMVRRDNIASGETSIHGDDGTLLGSFTLTEPLDMALVHDRRVYHGVTAVQAIDPALPAYRDVLVVTFRRR
ncbi:Hypothetical protein GbCGDNIH2_2096 [Granulibacter bethesdensis]|uniref:2OG-Fe dioxygenase family protein n=2 Tax=Granulibacter bethesdensis TaxID=364410 RepID=Q0BQA8_GRABC|nr:Hypothetical protein GbCGDNIH1_2096 [Granulibacter bethesdensis CGDNIH1]AHJ68043.1 Hypothetical protein GbCGDNIH2_2096 [Granulibacter bethesdensis]APH52865.1 Hypothetical protein GbCGDNIH5_2096 [Granulibacter bethesdensis]APH65553.1 Hypothetical protein GbCGDNIH1I4_2096 [Granulibacter bethesdensis]